MVALERRRQVVQEVHPGTRRLREWGCTVKATRRSKAARGCSWAQAPDNRQSPPVAGSSAPNRASIARFDDAGVARPPAAGVGSHDAATGCRSRHEISGNIGIGAFASGP